MKEIPYHISKRFDKAYLLQTYDKQHLASAPTNLANSSSLKKSGTLSKFNILGRNFLSGITFADYFKIL